MRAYASSLVPTWTSRLAIAAATCLSVACAEPGGDDDPERPIETQSLEVSTQDVDYAVGTVRIEMDVAAGRRLPVQIWYPADEAARAEAAAGHPAYEFEPPGARRDQLRQMADRQGDIYSQRTMHAAFGPDVRQQVEPFPLVLISHCNDCVRFAYFELAEELASKGFVVAAPDHENNTLYDYWNGTSVGVELDHFLETRRVDMSTLTDLILNASAVVVPEGLRGKIDPERIAMVGHSFGALTTSYASTRDPRIRAVVFLTMIASLGDNLPALGPELAQGVMPVKLSKPAMFLIATEDIIEIAGMNELIRQNWLDYPVESSLLTMKDAGHYSVTNICGIDPIDTNGCGSGFRATQFLRPFDYLNIDTATRLTAALVTSYLELQLNGRSASTLEGITNGAPGVLTYEHHE